MASASASCSIATSARHPALARLRRQRHGDVGAARDGPSTIGPGEGIALIGAERIRQDDASAPDRRRAQPRCRAPRRERPGRARCSRPRPGCSGTSQGGRTLRCSGSWRACLAPRLAGCAGGRSRRTTRLEDAFERPVLSYSEGMWRGSASLSLTTPTRRSCCSTRSTRRSTTSSARSWPSTRAQTLTAGGIVVAAGHDHPLLATFCEPGPVARGRPHRRRWTLRRGQARIPRRGRLGAAIRAGRGCARQRPAGRRAERSRRATVAHSSPARGDRSETATSARAKSAGSRCAMMPASSSPDELTDAVHRRGHHRQPARCRLVGRAAERLVDGRQHEQVRRPVAALDLRRVARGSARGRRPRAGRRAPRRARSRRPPPRAGRGRRPSASRGRKGLDRHLQPLERPVLLVHEQRHHGVRRDAMLLSEPPAVLHVRSEAVQVDAPRHHRHLRRRDRSVSDPLRCPRRCQPTRARRAGTTTARAPG